MKVCIEKNTKLRHLAINNFDKLFCLQNNYDERKELCRNKNNSRRNSKYVSKNNFKKSKFLGKILTAVQTKRTKTQFDKPMHLF